MIKIGLSQMLGKIRGGRGPLRDFFDFHNKILPALLFFKIEENCQEQSCSLCSLNMDNFCLKHISQKSTLKKLGSLLGESFTIF